VWSKGAEWTKPRRLSAALSQIERAFGKGSIMRLGKGGQADRDRGGFDRLPWARYRTRHRRPAARAGGGDYGPESSGKTTLALHCIAESAERGGICAFIDAEHALEPGHRPQARINIDDLLISQPDTGEQALEICDTLVPLRRRRGPGDRFGGRRCAPCGAEGEMGDNQPACRHG